MNCSTFMFHMQRLDSNFSPVLVEAATAVLRHMFSPDSQQGTQTMWGLNVPNNTHAYHRRSFNNCHCLYNLLFVDLCVKKRLFGILKMCTALTLIDKTLFHTFKTLAMYRKCNVFLNCHKKDTHLNQDGQVHEPRGSCRLCSQ